MDFRNFIKNNLRLVIFVLFVAGLTLYLFIDTRGSSTTTVLPPDPTELPVTEEELAETEEVTEGTEDLAVLDGEEIPMPPITNEAVEDFTSENEQLENRPSIIEDDENIIDNHEKIAENDQLALYLKEENLSIIMRDKESGAVMYSTVENPVQSNEKWQNFVRSGVVIEYLINTNIVYSQADMYSGEPTKEIRITANGFEADVDYPDFEFGYTLVVSLDGNKLSVEIPKDTIYENSDTYKVGNVYVYPYLGYSKLDEESGFMLIPDGSGAIINLEDNQGQFKQPYSEMIYGQNIGIDEPYVLSRLFNMVTTNPPHQIMAPYYGMIHEEKGFGFLATVEEGDYHAWVEAYPNGAILPYNWITSKFVLRQFYNQSTSRTSGTITIRQRTRNDIDIKTNYYFVSQDQADLMGLVDQFRTFLDETDTLVLNETQPVIDFGMRLDFMGTELEQGLINNSSVQMTTFEQADEMLEALVASGVEQLMIIYQGWETNGYSGALGQTSYSVDGVLGGNEGINSLIDKYSENFPIYLADDGLRFNPHLSLEVGSNLVKKYNRRVYNEAVFGKVFESFNFLEPEEAVSRLNSRVSSFEIENMALTGFPNNLFSYLKNNSELDRVHTAKIFEDSIANLSESKQLILDEPFMPYWKYADALYNIPLNSSSYIFEDQQVPFMSLALNGRIPLYASYSNFEPNSRDFFLRLVETGVSPSYLLTYENSSELHQTNLSWVYSSQYELYFEEIVQNYKELEAAHQAIGEGMITDYQSNDGVSVVTYDNGSVVYVNFNDFDTEIDEIELTSQSYKVVK
ncbi:DUF5696 domain-containing protein [Fundicoccus culcitae]|uniref:DUF5696 domain-containing protein n=1 Tax=Fundicoccus culcitae TaxID=2969821 RepID=A0ABY5P9E5_9LACT|nr:DUF5696 domain-containing protein [Fundicoccus culcitae]UUX35379.1 DUF5696 domain-containing protein [Fundicoccus culcitae]